MNMMKNVALAGTGVLAIALATGASAAPLSAQDSALYSNRSELGKATRGDARASVSAFLASKGKSRATTDSLVETARFVDKQSVTHIRYEQRFGGLKVHGAYVKAAFDRNGALSHLIERTAAAGGYTARTAISDAEALAVAVEANFRGASVPAFVGRSGAVSTFAKTSFFYRAPSVERVVISDRTLSVGFLVETWSAKDNRLYHTLVDGVGRIASNELRTADDSYNVFADHPGVTPQAVVSGPGAGNAQSPAGWLAGTQRTINIMGNNVNAYLDRDNNGAADAGGTTVSDGNFLTAANLTQAPTTTQNQAVAVQNLFYLNNTIHDRLYTHGFIEATGNFQENNFGAGGAGSDSVNAEAQDGGGTNNANFATPSDGSNPRMQMYLWTAPNPDRDGDLDSDIVFHEYGHGLTWRMIGGMSGDIAGAIGEGMSDSLAIVVNNEDRVGEYSTQDPDGIRSSRYSTHPDTLSDFNRRRGVHRNGEIYGATIWDVWQEYQAGGQTASTLLDDLVGGMNFTPATPSYIQMRDGILQQAPASRDCMVWRGFAGRGMGVGATMNSKSGKVTESFSVPSGC